MSSTTPLTNALSRPPMAAVRERLSKMLKTKSARRRSVTVANTVLALLATGAAAPTGAAGAPGSRQPGQRGRIARSDRDRAVPQRESAADAWLAITAITGDQLEAAQRNHAGRRRLPITQRDPLAPAPAGFGGVHDRPDPRRRPDRCRSSGGPRRGHLHRRCVLPHPDGRRIFALIDLDRVEILRGPQGTLSGMDSLGGSVKLYSKKATGNDDGYIEGTYGSLDLVGFRGSGDFTIIPGQLFCPA